MHFTTALLTLVGFSLNITPVHSAAVPTLDLSRRAEEPINSGDHSDMAEKRHFYFPGQDEATEKKRHFYFPGQDEATEKKRHFYFPGQDEATEKKRHFYFPGQDEAAEK